MRPQPLTAPLRDVGDLNKPVLLFDDHWALLKVVAAGVEAPLADRQRQPDRWAEWRQVNGVYELKLSSGKWEKLGSDGYPPLEKGYTFDGLYEALSVSTSGDSTFINAKSLVLTDDAKFVMGASGSSSYNDGRDLILSASSTPKTRGTYSVEGYLMTLVFDDGHTEKRGFVSGGKDWMLFVENTMYCHSEAGKIRCTPDF